MANAVTARITGSVLNVDHLSGVSRADSTPWAMTIVKVIVGGAGLSEVVLPRSFDPTQIPRSGEAVDWLVDIKVGRNGSINISYAGDFVDVAFIAA